MQIDYEDFQSVRRSKSQELNLYHRKTSRSALENFQESKELNLETVQTKQNPIDHHVETSQKQLILLQMTDPIVVAN